MHDCIPEVLVWKLEQCDGNYLISLFNLGTVISFVNLKRNLTRCATYVGVAAAFVDHGNVVAVTGGPCQ